jgi:hypothetical protein
MKYSIENMSLSMRRVVLEALIDADGHYLDEVSRRLNEDGIGIGAGSLKRFWESVQKRLRDGDPILALVVREIIAEKLKAHGAGAEPEKK